MNLIVRRLLYRSRVGCALGIFAVLLLSLIAPHDSRAEISGTLRGCAEIEDDASRLRCFDEVTGRKKPPAAAPIPSRKAEAAMKSSESGSEPSVMSRHWDLDPKSRENRSIIRAHRTNYMLPVAYNSTINQESISDSENNTNNQHTEAKFQISFKVKLWEDVLGKDMDLWFGYTQLAFWQLYNAAFSSPFRETNYEPELLLNLRTNYDILGWKGRIVNLGFNHQSNGQGGTKSRSWNRAVANFGFEKGNFNLLVKTWYRIPESAGEDDNPDITDYMGYGEVWGTWYWNRHRFAAMLRNNLKASNKGAVQLDWSFPFPFLANDRFSGYIQYFNGYGESLIDYNNTVNRISVGFMLTDWR